ncbi:MAG: type I-C CRISPR-associated protein Cas7/Csd2 [Acidobacteriota bacterium]|nr:type I-C CRISPR-associated protein Cas7/Csd2 [Blastocatellia bacterium]MDW8241102.1 type I-C CRISPR-associated protein Cas7/Csd2 [Acidobacteriota bacterium]
MTNEIYTDPKRRHDFVLLFDVTDGNPNGDPDAGNLPRVDPETMQGLVTDVCLKRKVRNYVLTTKRTESAPMPGYDIYVKERGVLNREHQRAYSARNIEVGEPASLLVPQDLVPVFAPNGEPVDLPEGFTLKEGEGDGTWTLNYSGLLDAGEQKEAMKQIEESLGKKGKDFASKVVKSAKSRKPTAEEVDSAQSWMCQQYFDIRAFGAVMSTGINCGQVRGPIQLTFARSVDPVVPLDLSITRVAVTREEDAAKEREMGRKALVPYGLYIGYGFVNPHFAAQTGLSEEDLSLLWEALQRMWDLDRSASRGLMACRGLYVFTHENAKGNAPAHKLFERIRVQRKAGVEAPRQFSDYIVTIADKDLPPGVTLKALVE